MTDQSRKDFEVFAKLQGLHTKIDEFGDYIEWETRLAYSAWKAARDIPVKLPVIEPATGTEFDQYCAVQCRSVLDKCRAAIVAAGYEVEE